MIRAPLPTVRIAFPAANAVMTGQSLVSSGADVKGDPSKIVSVVHRIDAGVWLASTPHPQYGWVTPIDTTQLADGPHTLTAKARTNRGKTASTSIGVTVRNQIPAPPPVTPPPPIPPPPTPPPVPVPAKDTWRDMLGVSLTAPSALTLDQTAAAGFKWVRLGWENWGTHWVADLTAAVTKARALGMRVLVCFQLTPHTYAATRIDEWRACWRSVAAIPGVSAFEIGNEWNNDWQSGVGFWRPYDPTWAMQAQFTIEAVRAAKQVNPGAVIITNGLSPYGKDDGGLDGNARWPQAATARLAHLLPPETAAGLAGWGNHPYCFPQDPRTIDAAHPGWYACARQRDVHQALVAAGWGNAPIWGTEWGSIGSQFTTEVARARHFGWYFEEFTAQAAAGVPLGPSFIHTFKDGDSGEDTMGLFRSDGSTPKAETWAVIQEWMPKPWPGVSLAQSLLA